MPVLLNPKHEAAAQALARFVEIEEAAVIGGLDPNGSSFASNARKFCNRLKRTRVKEIWEAAALINELDAAWLLRKLKAKAEYNIDDFLTAPNEAGIRFIDIRKASREQLEGLTELTIEEFTEGRGESAVDVRRTKIAGEVMAALNLIARVQGHLAPTKVAPTNHGGNGPAIVEFHWGDSVDPPSSTEAAK
jgi:phage terminase small subunit